MRTTFSMLPIPLFALILAPPVFSMPTSINDPFRAISLHVSKLRDAPICFLKPLPPVEPVEEDLLLSFEEWKAKQFKNHEKEQAKEKDLPRPSASSSIGTGSGNAGQAAPEPQQSDGQVLPHSPGTTAITKDSAVADTQPDELVSPHFRVPLTDRFNYAGMDCSARVHTSHRSAKSSSSILSSKKDRYMLSPCASSTREKQFVVVELCEDIRLDTVQLANFEFFSGVFKDFTVSVAKTYSTDPEGWIVAGTYKAKNVRGVQVCGVDRTKVPSDCILH
jgi:hypothetical protein